MQAEKLLRETLEWRRTYAGDGIASVRFADIAGECETGKLYIHGRDKLGRPVMYQKVGGGVEDGGAEKRKDLVLAHTLVEPSLPASTPRSHCTQPRRQNTKNYDKQVMQVAYMMEREINAMDVTKYVVAVG